MPRSVARFSQGTKGGGGLITDLRGYFGVVWGLPRYRGTRKGIYGGVI